MNSERSWMRQRRRIPANHLATAATLPAWCQMQTLGRRLSRACAAWVSWLFRAQEPLALQLRLAAQQDQVLWWFSQVADLA
jgi:hypothetical protein